MGKIHAPLDAVQWILRCLGPAVHCHKAPGTSTPDLCCHAHCCVYGNAHHLYHVLRHCPRHEICRGHFDSTSVQRVGLLNSAISQQAPAPIGGGPSEGNATDWVPAGKLFGIHNVRPGVSLGGNSESAPFLPIFLNECQLCQKPPAPKPEN